MRAIVNLQEGIYLETEGIKSFSIKEIQVNAQGDMCFALVCYPGPGAGYVVSRFNDEQNAHDEFDSLLNAVTNNKEPIFYTSSIYEEPKKKEAEVIGEAVVDQEENVTEE